MAKMPKRTPGRQKPRDSAHTKQKILDAAEEVFAEKGLTGARMREIARIADVNLALSNRYFKNKETLYLNVFENALQKIRSGLEPVMDSTRGTYKERIFHLIDAAFDFCFENRNYVNLVHRDVADGGPGTRRAEKYLRTWTARMIQLFQEGVDEGYIIDCSSRDAALTLYLLIMDYFLMNPGLKGLWGKHPFSRKTVEIRKQHTKRVFDNIIRS